VLGLRQAARHSVAKRVGGCISPVITMSPAIPAYRLIGKNAASQRSDVESQEGTSCGCGALLAFAASARQSGPLFPGLGSMKRSSRALKLPTWATAISRAGGRSAYHRPATSVTLQNSMAVMETNDSDQLLRKVPRCTPNECDRQRRVMASAVDKAPRPATQQLLMSLMPRAFEVVTPATTLCSRPAVSKVAARCSRRQIQANRLIGGDHGTVDQTPNRGYNYANGLVRSR
jgi:hypothetical protein